MGDMEQVGARGPTKALQYAISSNLKLNSFEDNYANNNPRYVPTTLFEGLYCQSFGLFAIVVCISFCFVFF